MGWLKKVMGMSQGGGGEGSAQAAERTKRAKMSPEELAAYLALTQQKADAAKVENADPLRPKSNINTGTSGKPTPGTDFSKGNYMDPNAFEALLKSQEEARSRGEKDVLIKRSRTATRKPDKGGTVKSVPGLGVPGSQATTFASLLGA